MEPIAPHEAVDLVRTSDREKCPGLVWTERLPALGQGSAVRFDCGCKAA